MLANAYLLLSHPKTPVTGFASRVAFSYKMAAVVNITVMRTFSKTTCYTDLSSIMLLFIEKYTAAGIFPRSR